MGGDGTPLPPESEKTPIEAGKPTDDGSQQLLDIGASPQGESAPREHRPRVFGKYAPFIVLVPYVVFLAGNMLGGWIEGAYDRVAAKKEKDPLLEAVGIARMYAQDDRNKDAEWLADFDWDRIQEIVIDEHAHVEELEEILHPFHNDKAGLDAEPFDRVRTEWESLRPIVKKIDEGTWKPSGEQKSIYPYTYTTTLAITGVLLLIAFPGYFKAPFSVSWLAVAVGVAGIFVWIGLWWLNQNVLGLAASGTREAFNPFEQLKDDPVWLYQFLAIRFTGLVIVVPFIEEFFLRGWLMRYIDDPDWDEVPLGVAGQMAIWGATIYGVVAHMGEPLAAAAWFTMVTWLYLRTKSIWDCVVAHAITNLLLGIYVITTDTWELW